MALDIAADRANIHGASIDAACGDSEGKRGNRPARQPPSVRKTERFRAERAATGLEGLHRHAGDVHRVDEAPSCPSAARSARNVQFFGQTAAAGAGRFSGLPSLRPQAASDARTMNVRAICRYIERILTTYLPQPLLFDAFGMTPTRVLRALAFNAEDSDLPMDAILPDGPAQAHCSRGRR